jgi:hypothetical protein
VAVGVHQNQDGDVAVSGAAYSLATNGNATGRNAPLVAHGVTAKSDRDYFVTTECPAALTNGGGMPGQGCPAALVSRDEVHPDIVGTLVASGAGLSRPAGMTSEPDLCVVYALQGNMIRRLKHDGPGGRSGVSVNLSFTLTVTDAPGAAALRPVPIQDKATRHNGGGPGRNNDGAGNGLGVGNPGDPAPTITSGDHHTVAAVYNRQRSDSFKEQGVTSTQSARQCKDATDLICESDVSVVPCRSCQDVGGHSDASRTKDNPEHSTDYLNPAGSGYIVRRLTPTECERLQGFPDGWTHFGDDGKEISDTRRYQMLGNSLAIPCVRFVLGNIAACIREEVKEK